MEKSVESLKQELEQMFDEMLRQIKLFKKKTYSPAFCVHTTATGSCFPACLPAVRTWARKRLRNSLKSFQNMPSRRYRSFPNETRKNML